MNNIRIRYLLAFLVLFSIEVFLALFIHDTFFRPYVGDVLVVIVLYFFVRIFFPYRFKHLVCYIFVFAVFVEFLQFINITELLNITNGVIATSVGSVFDFKDILFYALGCFILHLFEMFRGESNEKKTF